MPGPPPKPAALRQRTNKVSTAARLVGDVRVRQPKLPQIEGRDWHSMTVAWWRDIWRSPMAPEFLKADIHGLFRLATLVDEFWVKPSKDMENVIRQSGACYGLTPLDRRRLQWEVERVEQAQRKRPVPRPKSETGDPRAALRVL